MRSLALLTAVALVSLSGCVSPRYRFDKVAKRADVEVELRDLEDLIADSRRPEDGTSRPEGISREVIEYDFANEQDEYLLGPNDSLNIFVVGHPEMSSQRVNLGEISG